MPTKKNIETPELLWQYWVDYKKWCQENPYKEKEITTGGKNGDTTKIRYRERPPVFEGFEMHLREEGIINDLGDYESNKGGRYTEYATIIKAIKKDRNNHLKSGALSGIYKENMAARITGVTDKKEHKHSGGLVVTKNKGIELPDNGE